MNISTKDISITVSGGTGEATTTSVSGGAIYGTLAYVGIKSPSEAAIYDIAIYDIDDYKVYSETSITGTSFLLMESPINTQLRVVITSDTDGAYSIRLKARG